MWNLSDPSEWAGWGFSGTWPLSTSRTFAKILTGKQHPYGALMQIARRSNHPLFKHMSLQFGNSTSGPAAIKVGLRSSSFSTDASWLGSPIDVTTIFENLDQDRRKLIAKAKSDANAIGSDFGNIFERF